MIVRAGEAQSIDFEGLRILDYTFGTNLSSSFAQIEVPSGATHAQAWSKRSDKYYFVTRGRIQFNLDGDSAQLSEGDFVLVRQGQQFSYTNDNDEIAMLVLFHTPSFDPESEVFVDDDNSG